MSDIKLDELPKPLMLSKLIELASAALRERGDMPVIVGLESQGHRQVAILAEVHEQYYVPLVNVSIHGDLTALDFKGREDDLL